MAQKLQQAMLALSEDNRDMKMAMRMMLKYEVQILLDRLQELGEDSLLLLANGSEGTCSHLGTTNGNQYLSNCQSMCQLNLRESFLQVCSSNSGNSNQGNQGNMQPEGLLGTAPAMGGMPDMSSMKFKGKQLGYDNNRSHPYSQYSQYSSGQSGNPLMNNQQQGGQGLRNMTRKPRNYSKDEVDSIVTLSPANLNPNTKRKVCRHFARGHCWMEQQCSFLHVHLPEGSDKGEKGDKTENDEETT